MAIPQGFLGSNTPLVMTASKTITQNDLVMSLGTVQTVDPGADTSGGVFRGIANQTATSSSVAGTTTIDVCQEGVFLLTTAATLVSTAAGTAVYIATATSVDLAGPLSNDVLVGYLVRAVSTTQAYIRIRAN